MELTHFDENGRARMVDVSDKGETRRVAVARGKVEMQPETLERIRQGQIAKGDVLAVAQVAGIMGAKQTSNLIPMCHPLGITGAELNFEIVPPGTIEIEATVKVTGKTGVEMEALTAVSVAALTIYDMCKAIDKRMKIGEIRLMEKEGGKSGHFVR
ncbi:cyclic pyranopterin monophosphate synthase MoaC [Desulfitobacterium metallireducens]|uniref:Cyclic pyranopterin monophosphate synthase n=1 Tax=Desulfitobacterium metallireducens DSM 15288 TaxID=871968 RepID=W0E675_9FIRM|nr:cyclic pyranopterin monophosphate synthase MoaC [Desulfitobacterium metallireducens]AHF06375.1 molybdenum cofactor biosynthesis protein C [Desulfitobacterium metallireducens DSM 15288]